MPEEDAIRLENLKPAPGSRKSRKRVGRGRSSGHGKTSGRGQKGQKARDKVRLGSEGGQMPLFRRVPKLGGFKPLSKKYYEIVNVSELSGFDSGSVVDPEALREAGLIKGKHSVKILGDGEVSKVLVVRAHAFSRSAKEKIEASGGRTEVI